MPNLRLNGTEFYSAPKNAGTTVRMWVKQFEGEHLDNLIRGEYYSLQGIGLPRLWHDNSSVEPRFFCASEVEAVRWCIKRDPLERFRSGYTDKIVREGLAAWSIDETINMLEAGQMTTIAREKRSGWAAACHLLPQHEWLGNDQSYYDKIFDSDEMELVKQFCEDTVFKIKLRELHARNLAKSAVQKVQLTSHQRSRLEHIFSADYRIGWC